MSTSKPTKTASALEKLNGELAHVQRMGTFLVDTYVKLLSNPESILILAEKLDPEADIETKENFKRLVEQLGAFEGKVEYERNLAEEGAKDIAINWEDSGLIFCQGKLPMGKHDHTWEMALKQGVRKDGREEIIFATLGADDQVHFGNVTVNGNEYSARIYLNVSDLAEISKQIGSSPHLKHTSLSVQVSLESVKRMVIAQTSRSTAITELVRQHSQSKSTTVGEANKIAAISEYLQAGRLPPDFTI